MLLFCASYVMSRLGAGLSGVRILTHAKAFIQNTKLAL